MQQYAKAIVEFREKNKTYPTSIQQLKDARQPRMIRGSKGEYVDPLTGEVDWLVIPQAAGASLPAHTPPEVTVRPGHTATTAAATSIDRHGNGSENTNAAAGLPGIPIKDYAGGPFIGVRPAAHGKSLMTLFGADTYETWVYTTLDYDQEKAARLQAANTVFTAR